VPLLGVKTLEVRLKSYDVKPQTWLTPFFGDAIPTTETAPAAVTSVGENGSGEGGEDTAEAKSGNVGKRPREETEDEPGAATGGEQKPVRNYNSSWLAKDTKRYGIALPLMRGHTAFLTFAVAGLAYKELPLGEELTSREEIDSKSEPMEEGQEGQQEEETESN